MNINRLLLGLLSLCAACSSSVEVPDSVRAFDDKLPAEIDYNQHVKPILSDRCFKCHGPDKSKVEAGLQLVSYEGATTELKSGNAAIVPGDAFDSELVKRILSTDPEEVMPTPESHLTLSDEEKAILIKWIDQGAEYKKHWSLAAIRKPDVPNVGQSFMARWGIQADEETRWVRNEIDRFTLTKMKEKGLSPSPQADKATLLRRVYMDMTGLPPSPQEVQTFLKDSSPRAYEKVVDKLLQSPHFGEQQAISWLDVARYADSHGYQDDGMRNAYPYRDWVIKAFNQNMPFDKFVTYQLAGDLLPDLKARTRDALVATSFNRQHQQTQEGGIVSEEYRTEYVADRTNTFGKAFLGLTMECARCHDHKYDPISQKDYYSLFAFFNQNREFGMVPYNGEASPTVMLPSKDVEKQLAFIRTKIRALVPKLQPTQYQKAFATAKQVATAVSTLNQGLVVHLPLDTETNKTYPNLAHPNYKAVVTGDADRKPLPVPGRVGGSMQLQGDSGIDLFVEGVDKKGKKDLDGKKRHGKGLNFEANQDFSVAVWVNPLKAGITGAIFRRDNHEYNGFRGYVLKMNPDRSLTVMFNYVWPANCIELRTVDKLTLNQWQHLALTYDGSSKAAGIGLFINGKPTRMTIITDNLTKSLLHDEKGADFGNLGHLQIGKDERQKELSDFRVDEFRVYNRQLSGLEIQSLAQLTDAVASLQAMPVARRTGEQQRQLLEHYVLTSDSMFAARKREYRAWRGREVATLTPIPEVMVMEELPKEQARKTFVLKRGVYDAFGDEVQPETPLTLGALPEEYPRNRLGLAQWLLREDNPLFARVMVNRFWQQYFGQGLVKTQEDFGNQGGLPSHPELLDWLAATFRDGDASIKPWDVKALIRRIVLSATYQQSSVATKAAVEKDPDNTWLARGASYRYSAEQVRDNALAASGLLVRNIGGPSVYPYQPAGIWEALATRNVTNYRQQHGDSLYRRSMYTIWKRSSPPPMMLNFDAPDRSSCTVRRQKTATPLQALVTLNDPQFVEAARVLAERTLMAKPTTDERIHYFFLTALSRPPVAKELALMKQLLAVEQMGFRKNPERAKQILTVGEYPHTARLDPLEVAAYAVVANTILNYDEAIVKR